LLDYTFSAYMKTFGTNKPHKSGGLLHKQTGY